MTPATKSAQPLLKDQRVAATKRALVMGFFSTVGDIESLEIVRSWLDQDHIPYEVAPYSENIRSAMPGAVDPAKVSRDYTHLVVVCGPCWRQLFRDRKIELDKFEHCVRIGVNLTMLEPLEVWNPFDVLLERDSSRTNRPDLTFLTTPAVIPVVGRCLIERQKVYGNRQRHDTAGRAINELITRRNFAVMDVDTRCHPDITRGPTTPSSVFSLLKRVDFLLTTRLHGMVYALKAGIPVVAIDAIAGGAKVSAQARAIGWPMVVLAEDATPEWMDRAADWCLSPEAQAAVQDCQKRVIPLLREVSGEFRAAIQTDKKPFPSAKSARKSFWRWFH